MINACKANNLLWIKELVKTDKCSVNEFHPKNGKTGFIVACEEGHLELVSYLIQSKCDTNRKDFQGKTGFMHACLRGHLELVKYLADTGRNLHEKDRDGNNAITLALKNKHIDIVTFLIENGCEPVFKVSKKQNMEIYKSIQKRIQEMNVFQKNLSDAFVDIELCFNICISETQNKLKNLERPIFV